MIMRQRSFFIGIVIAAVLVLLGWMLVPTISVLSVSGALSILIIYALLAHFGAPRVGVSNPQIFQVAGILGLVAGIIFISEILWEYIVLPADNTRLGLIEFGSVFALYFISALIVAYRHQRLGQAV